jgi:hypothetical protein
MNTKRILTPFAIACAVASAAAATAEPCGSLTYEGVCQGDVAQWCEDGELVTVDCAAKGETCGWDADEGYFDCIDTDDDLACGDGLTYEGRCVDGAVVWCHDGEIKTLQCKPENPCGWNDAKGYFDCADYNAAAGGGSEDAEGGAEDPQEGAAPSGSEADEGEDAEFGEWDVDSAGTKGQGDPTTSDLPDDFEPGPTSSEGGNGPPSGEPPVSTEPAMGCASSPLAPIWMPLLLLLAAALTSRRARSVR